MPLALLPASNAALAPRAARLSAPGASLFINANHECSIYVYFISELLISFSLMLQLSLRASRFALRASASYSIALISLASVYDKDFSITDYYFARSFNISFIEPLHGDVCACSGVAAGFASRRYCVPASSAARASAYAATFRLPRRAS
jgi:hypothetical protein